MEIFKKIAEEDKKTMKIKNIAEEKKRKTMIRKGKPIIFF